MPERPVILQRAKRAIDIHDINLTVSAIKPDPASEFFTEYFVRDNHVASQELYFPLFPAIRDAKRNTPGQKFRVSLDIGDQSEHLVGRISNFICGAPRCHAISALFAFRA